MGSSRRAAAAAVAITVSMSLAGCTTLPANEVLETLDEATGTSLTRLAEPVELLTTEPRGPNADPFAYLAPFETNRMGRRRAYLWVAVPDERGDAAEPALSIAGRAIALGARQSERDAGLADWPYERPAPWSRTFVYELDATALRGLAAAGEWRLTLARPDGATAFAGAPQPPTLVADFIARLGAPRD